MKNVTLGVESEEVSHQNEDNHRGRSEEPEHEVSVGSAGTAAHTCDPSTWEAEAGWLPHLKFEAIEYDMARSKTEEPVRIRKARNADSDSLAENNL